MPTDPFIDPQLLHALMRMHLVEAIPDAMLIVDVHGRIVSSMPSATRRTTSA